MRSALFMMLLAASAFGQQESRVLPAACGPKSTSFTVKPEESRHTPAQPESGKALVYSSYLGGSGGDSISAIAVDSAGNAYVTGGGNSADFPRVNQIAGACNGGCGNGSSNDAFVTKINAAGNALVYSTFLGGASDDQGFSLAIDSSNDVYVVGYTNSTNFPTTMQVRDATVGPLLGTLAVSGCASSMRS